MQCLLVVALVFSARWREYKGVHEVDDRGGLQCWWLCRCSSFCTRSWLLVERQLLSQSAVGLCCQRLCRSHTTRSDSWSGCCLSSLCRMWWGWEVGGWLSTASAGCDLWTKASIKSGWCTILIQVLVLVQCHCELKLFWWLLTVYVPECLWCFFL